jgi:hypothetical protein
MQEQVDLKVLVEVPEVVNSNATSKKGNTLIWDLKKFKGKNIEFEFAFPNSGINLPIIPIVAIIAIIAVVIVVIVLLIKKRNNKEKIVNESTTSEEQTAQVVEEITPSVEETIDQTVEAQNTDNQV